MTDEVYQRGRNAARVAAVQALYQMETSGVGVEAVIAEFATHRFGVVVDGIEYPDADVEHFADILRGVVERQRRIDPVIERHLAKSWTLGRLDATARAILRAGVYELTMRADIPAAAAIDEYVEVADDFFGDGDEKRFVNAVLDAAAREARG